MPTGPTAIASGGLAVTNLATRKAIHEKIAAKFLAESGIFHRYYPGSRSK